MAHAAALAWPALAACPTKSKKAQALQERQEPRAPELWRSAWPARLALGRSEVAEGRSWAAEPRGNLAAARCLHEGTQPGKIHRLLLRRDDRRGLPRSPCRAGRSSKLQQRWLQAPRPVRLARPFEAGSRAGVAPCALGWEGRPSEPVGHRRTSVAQARPLPRGRPSLWASDRRQAPPAALHKASPLAQRQTAVWPVLPWGQNRDTRPERPWALGRSSHRERPRRARLELPAQRNLQAERTLREQRMLPAAVQNPQVADSSPLARRLRESRSSA